MLLPQGTKWVPAKDIPQDYCHGLTWISSLDVHRLSRSWLENPAVGVEDLAALDLLMLLWQRRSWVSFMHTQVSWLFNLYPCSLLQWRKWHSASITLRRRPSTIRALISTVPGLYTVLRPVMSTRRAISYVRPQQHSVACTNTTLFRTLMV